MTPFAAVLILIAVFLPGSAVGGAADAVQPARLGPAGGGGGEPVAHGGVLVPRRVRMIIGFVQTLPA